METYNREIVEYLKKGDTEIKRIILAKWRQSSGSLTLVLDNVLYKCGIISTGIMPTKTKWEAYINFTGDNFFGEEKGNLNLNSYPTSKKIAQQTLSKKIIDLLTWANDNDFRKRVENR